MILAVPAPFRIPDAARLLGVSADTVRRWVAAGQLTAHGSPAAIDGAALAAFAAARGDNFDPGRGSAGQSARNRLTGLVTRVLSDTVMSQVEVQVGRHRMVSLISTEAARELQLEPGALVVVSVKATNIALEVPLRH